MKKFYLIGMGVVFLFILILSLPQVGATCSWNAPLGTSTSPTLALFQSAGLGAILGGLSVFYWKSLKEPEDDEGTETPTPGNKPPEKMS
jgi:hypothetical protein